MTDKQKRVVVLKFSPIHQDARVLRQVECAMEKWPVTVIGYGSPPTFGAQTVTMKSLSPEVGNGPLAKGRHLLLFLWGKLGSREAYERWYWGRAGYQQALQLLVESEPTLIYANDWKALPVAVEAARLTQARILLDLNEYAPLEGAERWHWRVFVSPMIDYFLRRYVGNAAAFITVNETIARKYQQIYGFVPLVVTNAPHVGQVTPFKPTASDVVHLIHHGVAKRDRQLELMIQAVALAQPRFHLHFMLLEANQAYITELKDLAERLAPRRIFFHPAVAPTEIVSTLSQYDIGIYLLPFSNYNNAMALPNKFFDFVMAGLALCIGPSPEMARLTQEYGFGVVALSFKPPDVASLLNRLSAVEIDTMKQKAIQAQQSLNAAHEMKKLANLYHQLLDDSV